MRTLLSKFQYAVLALAALALVQPSSVEAQAKAPRLANTSWMGQETVTGRPTKLTFIFQAGGGVIMVDEVTPTDVKGSWRQEGDQVTITFSNCVYRGRLDGNRLAGTAGGTDGTGGNWNFNVTYMPPSPAPKFAK